MNNLLLTAMRIIEQWLTVNPGALLQCQRQQNPPHRNSIWQAQITFADAESPAIHSTTDATLQGAIVSLCEMIQLDER